MKHPLPPLAAAVALAVLAACSSQGPVATDAPDAAATASADAMSPDPAASSEPAVVTPLPSEAPASVLALEGLGDLRIGQPVPAGSSFAPRGAQLPGTDCKTLSSPAYPGVYALTEGGNVRRITVGSGSPVKLVEGIGPGSTEAEVLQVFPTFIASPHKYVAAPAKYLTQPGSDPRLRFEIGRDRKVSLVHVGMMPQLGYVEGCA